MADNFVYQSWLGTWYIDWISSGIFSFWTTNDIFPFTCSVNTCILLIRQSYIFHCYRLCCKRLQRPTVAQNRKPNKLTLVRFSTNVVKMLHTAFRRISFPRYNICVGLDTLEGHPNVAKNCTALRAKAGMEVVPKKSHYVSILNFSPRPMQIPKYVYCNHVCFSGLHYAVRIRQHIKNPKTRKWKVGNESKCR